MSARASFWSASTDAENMGEELSTITTWAAAIADALEGLQVAPQPLFAQAGLEFDRLRDVDARYHVGGMTVLWRLAAEATNSPHIGLLVASQMQPGALHALGSALLASTSLADSFQRLDRYSRLVSNAGRWIVAEQGQQVFARLEVVEQGVQVADEAVDAFLAAAVRIGRLMTLDRYRPLQVHLVRTAPARPAVYREHFGCPVQFDAACNGLLIDLESWHAPVRGANPAVAQATERIARDYLARFDRERIGHRARSELLRQLPAGEPSLAELAATLQLSARSLQRRLGDEGLSYKQLLDETRRELAMAYLGQSRHSLTEIAFLLGFSDQSNFNRAFRRWTGQSPRQFRTHRLRGASQKTV